MLTGLTNTAIIAQATTWVAEFDATLLTIVGLGIGFAVVRFTKSLFF